MTFSQERQLLADKWGIHMPGIKYYSNERIAMDAYQEYSAVTEPNAGVPSILNTMVDPEVIRSLITPVKSEEIYGVVKKGDVRSRTIMFPVAENSGIVAPYGDFSQSGMGHVNVKWINRQSFYYESWAKTGDLETAVMGLANIQLANEARLGAATALNKMCNQMNLWGVSGLQLYGALNDPNLPTPIQPTAKANPVGSGTVTKWTDTSDPVAIYGDFTACYSDLVERLMGLIDNDTPIITVIPSERAPVLKYINSYGLTLEDMLKKGYPNMTIKTLPEAGVKMSGGNATTTLMQMFVPVLDGVQTVSTAFTEKLIMHRLETYSSYMQQKMSQGGWGTIWKRPQACAMMVGI